MDVERLKALGFTLMCGQVDYKGKNYGTFNHHGALLTDEGDALVEQLEDERARAKAPAAKAARKTKPAADTPPPETSDAPVDDVGLNAAIDQE